MPAKYAIGLALHLPDPRDEQPMGLCRDELLFTLVDRIAEQGVNEEVYELREVLSADLPMASGSDDDVGDLVVTAKSDNVGGPMRPERAAPLLAALTKIGTEGSIPDPLAKLVPADRAFLLPPYVLNTVGEYAADHIFHGVELRSLVDVLNILNAAPTPELAHAIELFTFCRDNRFFVSFQRT
jgi:hypothetical protein